MPITNPLTEFWDFNSVNYQQAELIISKISLLFVLSYCSHLSFSPTGMASLFVKIDVKDYIPSEMADFANALVDPIAHLSKVSLSVVSFIITFHPLFSLT